MANSKLFMYLVKSSALVQVSQVDSSMVEKSLIENLVGYRVLQTRHWGSSATIPSKYYETQLTNEIKLFYRIWKTSIPQSLVVTTNWEHRCIVTRGHNCNQFRISPTLPPPKCLQGPPNANLKKLCCATPRGRLAFKTNVLIADTILIKPGPQPSFKVLGSKTHF